MNKPFYMMPCAGLANRIRSMVSAMCYAQDAGIKLHVLWRQEPGICMSPFYSIFGMTPEWMVVDDIVGHPVWPWKEVFTEDGFCEVKDARPLLIKSHQIFYKKGTDQWFETLRTLKIKWDIVEAAEDLMTAPNFVGVHIRRTDHTKATRHSTSWSFWSAMDKYAPDTKFYLATDDLAEREEAVRRYGDRIIYGPKKLLGRNSPDGCKDAMLDMICLSSCSEIIGSYASSFSEMAAALGNVPLKIA